MCQKVKDHTVTKITGSSKDLIKHQLRPFYKYSKTLHCEDETKDLFEITSHQKKCKDDKPIHIGVSILQYSKLMMLEFVNFLNKFLIKDSFSLVYSGK